MPALARTAPAASNSNSFFMMRAIFWCRLWENQIQVAPILGGRCAFAAPVRSIVEMVRYLRRPVTTHEAVVNIALHGLAQSRRAACGVHLPTRREHQRACHGDVRALRGGRALQCDYIFIRGTRNDVVVDTCRFLIQGAHVSHEDAFLSANCSRKPGFLAAMAPEISRQVLVQSRIQSQ